MFAIYVRGHQQTCAHLELSKLVLRYPACVAGRAATCFEMLSGTSNKLDTEVCLALCTAQHARHVLVG